MIDVKRRNTNPPSMVITYRNQITGEEWSPNENGLVLTSNRRTFSTSLLPGMLDFLGLDPRTANDSKVKHIWDYPGFSQDLGGVKLVDIGGGEGWLAALFQHAGLDAYVTDLFAEPNAFYTAEEKALRFKKADARDTGYPDHFFKIIVSFNYLSYFHDRLSYTADVLREMTRILEPGGFMLLSPNTEAIGQALESIPNLEIIHIQPTLPNSSLGSFVILRKVK